MHSRALLQFSIRIIVFLRAIQGNREPSEIFVMGCATNINFLNTIEVAENGNKWQYCHQRFHHRKTKNPAKKRHPSEYWTWDLSHLDLMISSLSYKLVLLGRSKIATRSAILVFINWSKSNIQVVQEQKTIQRYAKQYMPQSNFSWQDQI